MTDDVSTPTKDLRGPLRRALQTTLRVSLTIGVAATAMLAVQFGSEELTRRAEAAPSPDPAPVLKVATTPIVLESGFDVTRSFIGQVEAQRSAAVSFELAGRLDDILVDEGDTVALGQHIATLDTRLLDAERDSLLARKSALEAQLRFARQTAERQSKLNDQGFASQAALDEALSRSDELAARISEVEAGLVSNAVQTEKSKVFAPFEGRVTDRRVDGGESVSPGQTLIEIVENSMPHVRVGVPLEVTEADLTDVNVDVEGRTYAASLVTLRPDIDRVTRTRIAILRVEAEAPLAFGQTANLRIRTTVEAEGFWVPVTTLKEGLRGQWTLLAVDPEDTVRALSVQILHSSGEQVFVRGAFPEGTQRITNGPQRVTVGQTVDPKPST